jgi:hypothetical protein
MGRRDYAILLILARLGLRAGEIRTLALEDLDWQAGLITVRGKAGRYSQMPLPAQVGEAIADYLQHGGRSPTVDACFSGRERQQADSRVNVASVLWCGARWRGPGLTLRARVPISSATDSPLKCFDRERRCLRSANCYGIAVRRPLRSTPRWIWFRSRHWPCRGREVHSEPVAQGGGGLRCDAPQFGLQTTGRQSRPDKISPRFSNNVARHT